MFKSSIQRELDSFFTRVSGEDFNIREVSKGAFTQARAKLNPWAFIRLNEIAVDTFYQNTMCNTWHGMRTLAVDGTRLTLPNHKTVKEEFGEHHFGPNADSPRSLAIGSMLYDVLNHLTIDAQIAPYSSSEKTLLLKHLDKVKKGDMLLLDRGYPSFSLFFLLKAKGIEFTVRMKDDWWLAVKEFKESGEKERKVAFTLPKKDKEKLADYPEIAGQPITCRLLRIDLPDGKIEILCTSLLDGSKYLHNEFKDLYHYRWNEEEAYKLLKNRIELEDFSGKTARAVRQDFHAKIFLLTLMAAYAHPIEEKVLKEFKADKNRKHGQKINRTNAISVTSKAIPELFIKNKVRQTLKIFDDIVYKTREIIRPNREEKRKHRQKKQYSMAYKKL
jgi:hypothetical protein